MSMTVRRRKDTRTPKVLMHKVADIRGGVSVSVGDGIGDYLPEGAPLSAPDSNGICHVVKFAKVLEAVAADGTSVKVAKGHNLKANDIVMASLGAAAVTVSAIDTSNSGYDTLTITAIGALAVGDYLVQAKETSTAAQKKSDFKYAPFAVNGTGKVVVADSNLDTDAWVIAVTKGNALPAIVADALKGVINY